MQNLNPPKRQQWSHLVGASAGLALVNAIQNANQPLLVVAPDQLQVSRLIEELTFFGQNIPVIHFPDWETLPYDHFSPHQDIISARMGALHHMESCREGVIITTFSTLMQRLPPRSYLDSYTFLLNKGDRLDGGLLRERLVNAGYHSVSQVREHGEFAIRGSLIDVFPMGSHAPFRIDLLGDEIDSIRYFSPDTQRSNELVAAIRLLPAKEFPLNDAAIELFRENWRGRFTGNPLKNPIYQDVSEGIYAPGIEYYLPLFFTKTATFFDYLPPQLTLVTFNDAHEQATTFWQEVMTRYEQGRFDILRPLLPPETVFLPVTEVETALKIFPRIEINSPRTKINNAPLETEAAPALDINHRASEPLAALQAFIQQTQSRVLFCAESTGRREVILQLFRSIDLVPTQFDSWQAFIDSQNQYGITVTPLEVGFILKNPAITLITETELYGKRVMQRRLRKPTQQDPDALIRDLTELQMDDPIVHIDHGVGRYRGLQTLTVGEETNEFLCLEYQGGDKLYVPVASLHLIARYTGADPEHTPMNKLGTDHWLKAKRKAAEKVKDVAAELLDLYAKRAARPGEVYTFPEDQYAKFAAQFPFEETPDQLQAIDRVIGDLTSTKPMDRVICGDVGFGKTEVALRAAFLAVQNNKQVVLLVPTTLLAQQHFQLFQDRFADWPIQVEMLSRFRSGKEQQKVLEKMANGQVDIVIGTHKLLQADIKFKALGLVIIDEEHRFGVKQKERLKALRISVDLLTLTATPIPRTLNMALAGIRDLSLIATPPSRRLSVKTFVHTKENHIIQEAVLREILRGGQVYFLHNEVSTIQKQADELKKLIPEARITIAHGQMHEKELERVMAEFYHRHTNVLVCSTIIESGIDIPTANTIIINRADKFGIAQLHQLRGRVGRSHHQAYAYLLIPTEEQITADAKKRLEAIATYDDLGIGFTLATHDLEIRGAGELLGEEQSGNMHEIGFSLYMDLLSRAVDNLKSGKEMDLETSLTSQQIDIDLHITALIPETYLADVSLRLQFYKRIANTKTVPELDEIQVEMIDRFGLLPGPLKNLFAIHELRQLAQQLGIIKLEATTRGGKIEFNTQPTINPETLISLLQANPPRFRLEGPTRLRFTLSDHEKDHRVEQVRNVLTQLKG